MFGQLRTSLAVKVELATSYYDLSWANSRTVWVLSQMSKLMT